MSFSPPPDPWLPMPASAASLPAAGEIDLWRLDLQAGDAEDDRAILSGDERARAARFLDPAVRRRHERTRASLKRLLGACLHAPPALVQLEEGPHGKPRLAREAGQPDLQFNVSHSGETALIALAVGHPVGVDLEQGGRRAALAGIAERWFTAEERAAWRAEDRREASFFRIWTRKEAVLKAHGGGLAAGMTGFSVAGALPGGEAVWPPGVLWEGTPYALLDLDLGQGAAGAVALAGIRAPNGLKLRALV